MWGSRKGGQQGSGGLCGWPPRSPGAPGGRFRSGRPRRWSRSSVAKYSEQNIATIFLKNRKLLHTGPKKVAILRFLLNKIRKNISQGTPKNRTLCDISQALATLNSVYTLHPPFPPFSPPLCASKAFLFRDANVFRRGKKRRKRAIRQIDVKGFFLEEKEEKRAFSPRKAKKKKKKRFLCKFKDFLFSPVVCLLPQPSAPSKRNLFFSCRGVKKEICRFLLGTL